jgi:peptidoglycan/xylan/chitin deacetylase (PgdA/CDA1 family)
MGWRSLRLLPSRYIPRVVSIGNLVAPCYHIVSDRSQAHVRHLYRWRDIRAFKSDLDYLLTHFKPLSLSDLHTYIESGKPVPDHSLFVSFDDGFREMSEVVAPLCRQKGVPVTFFLTTGFLDNKILGYRHKASLLIDVCLRRGPSAVQAVTSKLIGLLGLPGGERGEWSQMLLSVGYGQQQILDECAALLEVDFNDYLRTVQPYLTRGEVRNLLRDGFSIGGHSIDHPRYADLTLDRQLDQTRGCMEDLQREFPLPVKAFAFPFVSDGVSERFYEEMFASQIADLVFCIGQMPKKDSRKAVQRFGVESETASSLPDLFSRQVEGRLRQKLAGWRRRVLTSV